MKAVEYVKLLNSWEDNPPKLGEVYDGAPEDQQNNPADLTDQVTHLAHLVLKEFDVIRKARKAETPEALDAIVRELDQKWKAIARRTDKPLPPDFFLTVANTVIESNKS